jgi:hypothetical protein
VALWGVGGGVPLKQKVQVRHPLAHFDSIKGVEGKNVGSAPKFEKKMKKTKKQMAKIMSQ